MVLEATVHPHASPLHRLSRNILHSCETVCSVVSYTIYIASQAYMFFQLLHFNPDASIASISTRCGLLVGCKTGAHVCTGLIWGRVADHAIASRKTILVIGLLASSGATVGYGFSTTFYQAISWQILDGAFNATVAMVRCMTSELNPEKKSVITCYDRLALLILNRYRVRALTLLPLFANIGSVLGPLIGGFLASTKTERSIVSGYPFAMPNVCIAGIQAFVAVFAILSLNDTFYQHVLDHAKSVEPLGTPRGTATAFPSKSVPTQEITETTTLLSSPTSSDNLSELQRSSRSPLPLPFVKIWTPNVIRTMIAQFIIAGHLGTFVTLWAMFLSLPTVPSRVRKLPFQFSGGMGFQPHRIGVAMSTFGFAGIVLQILIYPKLQERWGTIRLWRAALCLFPIVYLAAPFCALVPLLWEDSDKTNPGVHSVIEWFVLLFILLLFAAGRTGVVPATTLLINDCTPHPSVRGTIHTAGVICSNLSRSLFPPLALTVMGYGLKSGVVGLGFWFVAVLAVLSILASLPVQEGTNGE